MFPISRSGAVALFSALLLASCADPLPDTATAVSPPPTLPPALPAGAHPDIRARLEKLVGVPPDALREADAPGMLEARWGTEFAYVTADGQHVVYGDLLDLQTGEALTERSRKAMRLALLDELGDDNMIRFVPDGAQNVITVFTDLDCGYCRKMHREIDDYNQAGIGVRYVFYPRSGPGTDSFRKAETVWCADDRKAAFTSAKAGKPVAGPSDCDNPVLQEYQLGKEIGLRGTPLIVLPDGEVVNGYVPAPTLAAQFAVKALQAQQATAAVEGG
ncbi:DsbC family protein [Flagellatimonas centrodinii]|uniref:DsbC family protein n=1 Tax=Flagellatimonas centrodinii TaxID=2806210 RepID=UPI001FEDF45B|nr:DsbC family protein [Flagellatimonas centrodinii]ULQ46760.1 DsbC family protein [Flagellatimonas centrodinii]